MVLIRSELGERDAGQRVLVDCRVKCKKTGKLVQDLERCAVQAEAAACDINRIMDRYSKTGQLPDLIRSDARYGDFTSVPDFHEAMDIVIRAEEQFAALDARVRDRFENDPAKMLAFCSDPKNSEAMIELGLALPKKAVEPSAGPVQGSAAVVSSTPNPEAAGAPKTGAPVASNK